MWHHARLAVARARTGSFRCQIHFHRESGGHIAKLPARNGLRLTFYFSNRKSRQRRRPEATKSEKSKVVLLVGDIFLTERRKPQRQGGGRMHPPSVFSRFQFCAGQSFIFPNHVRSSIRESARSTLTRVTKRARNHFFFSAARSIGRGEETAGFFRISLSENSRRAFDRYPF